jgi:hypothetical protein
MSFELGLLFIRWIWHVVYLRMGNEKYVQTYNQVTWKETIWEA